MKEEFGTKVERNFHQNRAISLRKRMKPVRWEGMEFESIAALARHHRATHTGVITKCIKESRLYRGCLIEFIKKEIA